MKTKVVYIISFIDKALSFEWIAEHIDSNRFILRFILLNPGDSSLEQFLSSQGIECHRINYSGKKDFVKAFLQTLRLLLKIKPEVVHTHLFDANLIGLSAAFVAGVKRRIHTRHNSTIHHEYFPKAVKYDKWANTLSTNIIAITKNVEEILIELEGVKREKIIIIHHGFDFSTAKVNKIRAQAIREKYDLSEDKYYVGVVSRFIHWKGLQHIIPAFKKFHEQHPNAMLVLANAHGPYEDEVKNLLKSLKPKSFVTINFEPDIFALFNLFNVFVHVPINERAEAFGQVYIEAMACEIPMIITKSGIAREIMEDNKNSLIVPFEDSSAILSSLLTLYADPSIGDRIVKNGKKIALEGFGIKRMIHALETLYQNNG